MIVQGIGLVGIIGVIGIIVLLVLIYSRMWIGFAMLFVGFWGIVLILGWEQGLRVLAIVPYRNIANYTFAAIPLFLLMGVILYNTGFAQDLFYSAYKCIGEVGGGLAMASCIAAAILGVITDSFVAAITLGKAAIPEMKKYNYNDALAGGSIVGGASLASLMPPSIGFIMYGMLTEQSISKLYIGAVIPAVLLTIVYVILIAITVKIKPGLGPAGPKTKFKEKVASLKYTWSIIVLFLFILGGIYGGVFTPTEAGAIGAFASIIIGLIARRLTIKNLYETILETSRMTAMICLMVAGAYVFQTLMTLSKLPLVLGDFVVGLDLPRFLVMSVIILIYIFMGMFTDIIAAILITVPILTPVIVGLGFDPIWFGILVVILIELGMVTPPIGMNLFMFSATTGVPIPTLTRGVLPFVGVIIIFVIILILFPQIVTFLPNTM